MTEKVKKERNVVCPLCAKRFYDSTHARGHVRKQHPYTRNNPFPSKSDPRHPEFDRSMAERNHVFDGNRLPG